MNCLMVRRAASVFASVPGIRPKIHRARFLLIHPDFTIRFQKLDKYLRTRSNKTKQSAVLLTQKPLPLDDMPAPTHHLTAGYQLDSLGVDVSTTHLTYQNGRQVEWSISLGDGEAGTGLVEIRPNAPMPKAPAAKVRLKRQLVEGQEAEGTNDGTVQGSNSG